VNADPSEDILIELARLRGELDVLMGVIMSLPKFNQLGFYEEIRRLAGHGLSHEWQT
jgi:hypothetical protein